MNKGIRAPIIQRAACAPGRTACLVMVGLLLVFSRAGFIGSPLAAVVAALLVLKYTATT
jgi:hypothetical protein